MLYRNILQSPTSLHSTVLYCTVLYLIVLGITVCKSDKITNIGEEFVGPVGAVLFYTLALSRGRCWLTGLTPFHQPFYGCFEIGKDGLRMVHFFGSITGQKKLTLANVSIWPQLWTSHYCANKNIESVEL